MPIELQPLGASTQTAQPQETFALFGRDRAERLARAMPDARSAVLMLLAWNASVQEKMSWGPLAGQPVARISGPELARISGKPLRTIRWAIAELRKRGQLECSHDLPGQTAIYRLPDILEFRAE